MLKSVIKLEPPSPPHSGISCNIDTDSSVLLKTENGQFLEDGHEEMRVSDQQQNAESFVLIKTENGQFHGDDHEETRVSEPQQNAEISSVLIKTENGQFRVNDHEETRLSEPHQNAESSFVVVKTEDGQFLEDDNGNSTVCDVEHKAENSFVQVKIENGQFLEDGHKESKVSDMEHNAGDEQEVAGDPLEEIDVIPKVELTVNFEDELEEGNPFKESEEVNNSEILQGAQGCSSEFTVSQISNDHLRGTGDEENKMCYRPAQESDPRDQNVGPPEQGGHVMTGAIPVVHQKVRSKAMSYRCRFCIEPCSHGKTSRSLTPKRVLRKPHACKFCSRSFSYRGSRVSHEKIHTGSEPFFCKYCPRRFCSSNTLAIHERIHTGEKLYLCQYCPEAFSFPQQLTSHLKVHAKNEPWKHSECGDQKNIKRDHERGHEEEVPKKRPWKCHLCDEKFSNCKALTAHVRPHVREPERFLSEKPEHHERITHPCRYCDRVSFSLKSLRGHEKRHKLPLQCCFPDCDKTFLSNEELKRHKLTHTEKLAYQCNLCDEQFANGRAISTHVRFHSFFRKNSKSDSKVRQEKESPLPCSFPGCDKSFHSNEELRCHKLTHTEKLPPKCQLRDEKFEDRRSVSARVSSNGILHRNSESDSEIRHKTESLLPCSFPGCDKLLRNNEELTRHKLTHTEKLPWKCNLCDKNFVDLRSVSAHLRSHGNFCQAKPESDDQSNGHKKQLSVPCSFPGCNKLFSNKEEFRSHNLAHTERLASTCKLCDKKFVDLRALSDHVRAHGNLRSHDTREHDEELPLSCCFPGCDKFFLSSEKLRCHKLTHTEMLPFQCNLCDEKFADDKSLSAHVRSHVKAQGQGPLRQHARNSSF